MKYFASLNTLNVMKQFHAARPELQDRILLDHLTCELRRMGASRTQASRLVSIHAQLSFRSPDYSGDLDWFVRFHTQGLDIHGVIAKGFGRNNISVEDFLLNTTYKKLQGVGKIINISLVNCYYNTRSARIEVATNPRTAEWDLLPFSFNYED